MDIYLVYKTEWDTSAHEYVTVNTAVFLDFNKAKFYCDERNIEARERSASENRVIDTHYNVYHMVEGKEDCVPQYVW